MHPRTLQRRVREQGTTFEAIKDEARRDLALPVHELRLHIHPFEGSGDGLCGFDQETKEPITVTHTEIIYRRRLAVLEHAQRTGNVAETCRVFGISRTRYYEWKNRADLYGLDALMPKERRAPPDALGHPHPCGRAPA